MTAYLLTIGDEILIGQIIDTNSAWLSQQLNLNGIQVVGKASVGDTEADIRFGLDMAFQTSDFVITTGGLGPTKDDITKQVLADYFGYEMAFHEETYGYLEAYFTKIKRRLPDSMRFQATLPTEAEILRNKVGAAPAMWFEKDGHTLVALPGVPYEMKHLMEVQVLPKVRQHFGGKPIAHRTLLTCGEGESAIAERLDVFVEALPQHIKLAYLPGIGQVRLRLSGVWDGGSKVDGQAVLEAELEGHLQEMKAILKDIAFGEERETLPEVLGKMLQERGLSIGTAESCTGGHVAHLITSIAGSSEWYPGSVVAYSYELKTKLLGVKTETLQQHGAVSSECVAEMAKGLIENIGCSIAVALSGIAGPRGGLPDKPVGTVWVAVADAKHCETKQFSFGQDRIKNIERSSIYALNMVRQFLLKHY